MNEMIEGWGDGYEARFVYGENSNMTNDNELAEQGVLDSFDVIRAVRIKMHRCRCRRTLHALSNRTGVSLVIALLALLILTIVGISAMSTAIFETGIAGNERIYSDAFYMADAGIDFFFATCTAYVDSDAVEGSIDSRELPLQLGERYFLLHWTRIREETGPPRKAEFRVISEGISSSVPTSGKVRIEAAIEAVEQEARPKAKLRSWREIF